MMMNHHNKSLKTMPNVKLPGTTTATKHLPLPPPPINPPIPFSSHPLPHPQHPTTRKMPHTSHRHRHRHPPNPRPQRTKTTEANGWTTIRHGPNPNPPPRRPPSPTTSPANPPTPSPSDIQALTTNYAHQQDLWANSNCAARLRAIVAERVRRNDVTMVENCVVLGLGSLGSGSAAGPGWARKSLLQLAALEDLLGCLSAWRPFLIFVCLRLRRRSTDGITSLY